MVDVLKLSARIIHSGLAGNPVTRMTQKAPEVAERVAPAESFSHSIALRTDTGLVVFDACGQYSGNAVQAPRLWSADPVHAIGRDLGRAGLLAPIEWALRFLAGAASPVAPAMVLAR